MPKVKVIIRAAYGDARLVETPANEFLSPGWAIGRQEIPLKPLAIYRKFEFEEEARRAWDDVIAGATLYDIQSRDYSGSPAVGESVPLVDHSRLRKGHR